MQSPTWDKNGAALYIEMSMSERTVNPDRIGFSVMQAKPILGQELRNESNGQR